MVVDRGLDSAERVHEELQSAMMRTLTSFFSAVQAPSERSKGLKMAAAACASLGVGAGGLRNLTALHFGETNGYGPNT